MQALICLFIVKTDLFITLLFLLTNNIRLEIIVVAGLNNVRDNQSAEDIMDEISELQQAVQAHTDMHDHAEPSIVSVSTLLYAPKFCFLDVPENCLEWKPPAGFHNRREMMEKVNAFIKYVNFKKQKIYI